MPTFTYKAKDRTGNTVTGTVDADNPSHAAGMVRELGHLPMDIRLASSRPSSQSKEAGSAFARYVVYPLWTGVNIKALAFFYRQLATLLGSGMTLSEALRSVGNRTRGRLGVVIAEGLEAVQNGGRFSDVIARYPRIFGRLQVSLVRVGETGGMLETMADRIASYLEYEIKIRQMIARMTIYPVAVLVFAFAAYVGIPHVEKLIKDSPAAFFAATWPQTRDCLVAGLVLVVVLKLIFQFDITKLVWDAFKINIPLLGVTARKIAMSRFCRAMALLYSGGMSSAEAVSVSAEASGNQAITRALRKAVPAIQAGQGLTESLARTGAMLPIVLDMLATGEKVGSPDTVLVKVADYMDDEADTSIQKAGIALFILMILAAGAVVLSIVLKFYLGSVANTLQQGGDI